MTKNLSLKKWCWFVTCLLVMMISVQGYSQTCGLVTNSGFESDLTGWTNSGNAVIVNDVHTGTKAVRVGTGQGGVNSAGLMPVTAGAQLTFQVWAKISASPVWAGVGVDFLNASGQELSEIELQITSTTYALRSITQIIPAGAVNARIWTWKSGSSGNLFLDDFCITVPTVDAQAPSVPAGLASTAITTTSFTLNWTASTDNVGVTGYEVFRNGTSIGTPTATTLNVTALTAGTAYAMTIRARDAAGNFSAQSTALTVTTTALDTQAPTVPTDLASSLLTQTGFTLTWAVSTDNVGVTGYQVFRNGTSIGTPSGTSFNVTGLTAATTHSLTVRARDAAGNFSVQSAALSVTTPDTQAPSVPNGLSSSAITQTGFILNWTASTDNVGVTGYEVFRNGTSIGIPTATTFTVTALTAGTPYAMTVSARDAAGNFSGQSTTLNVTTAAAPPTSCGSITNNGFESGLTSWVNDGNTVITTNARSGSSAAATGPAAGGLHYATAISAAAGQTITFSVWAKISGTPSWAGVGFDYLDATGTELGEGVINVTGTTYAQQTVTGTAPAGTASISVWTWKSGTSGNLFLDDFCLTVSGTADTQAPTVPAGLASSNLTATSFTLTWTASTDNTGVTGYEVFRNGTSIGTPTGTTFSVTGLAASTAYAMSVRARDASGNFSAQSTALNVTTTSGGGGGNFNITINKGTQFQTIDGFGFFGAQDVWWSNPSDLWSDSWGDQVISDLGITIWRNEYYPPSDNLHVQDADWNKQRPVVQGLKNKAAQYGVDLKFIFTVWSPPASMKVQVDNNTRLIGTPHPFGTKAGGALDPTKYIAFANYLKTGIQLYKDLGINLYAFSPQNEPFFVHGFNSCWYKQEWYPEMLNGVIPTVKAAFPNVKVFGSEGMLEMEAADNNWPWFYHQQIVDVPGTRNNIDILAIHGYSDGVAPTSGSTLGHLWSNHKSHFGDELGKPQWMTETSGYEDSWVGVERPGAFSLALDMMSGLNNGNMSGWVWWQGSENPGSSSISLYALMNGSVKGKKYYASKQFYRYIRPGAVRVAATSTNNSVSVSAYQHTANGTHTILLANTSANAQSVTVGGLGLPASFVIFRTSASENCVEVGPYTTGASLSLPARSIVTLQAGGTPLATTANARVSTISNVNVLPTQEEMTKTLVYPNPVREQGLTVKLSKIQRSQATEIELIDVSGKIIKTYSVTGDKLEIRKGDLPVKGIYVLKITTGANTERVKLLVE
jgi:chitodextrinase/O-glycosyl hydrolase